MTTLLYQPLVFLDLETTGLTPVHGHRICEIAWVRVCDTREEHRFSTLINPHRPVEAQAFAVNGISHDMLCDAPSFDSIVATLRQSLDGSVVVAHNAPFDMGFLSSELSFLGLPALTNPVLDTLTLARLLMPTRPSHSLHALALSLGLHRPDHRAMSDVLALQDLYTHLAPLMHAIGLTTLDEVLRYQRGLLPGDPELVAPPLIHQAIQEQRLLRFTYTSLSTPMRHERIVRPIDLARLRGKIYLRAFCFLRKDQRSFALDKIQSMEIMERQEAFGQANSRLPISPR